MRIRLEQGGRLPDGRTRSAVLALMAFATIVVLASTLVWTIAGRAYPSDAPLRATMATDAPAEPQPVWRSVAARHGGFDVDAPRWKPLGMETTHLRRSDGLSRELFQFGEAADVRRHAALVVDRGDMPSATTAEDLASVAADLGAAMQVTPSPLPLVTKFGPMAAADLMLDTDHGPKACLGFMLHAPDAALRIAGWVCNGGPEIVSRQEASCFIDRLFAVGVRDGAIGTLFARAELARQPCPAQVATTPPASAVTDRNGRPAPLRFTRL
ncbi:MAG: hypothetical protein Q8S29_04780 [Phreatobacter sp.]|nr:hypothetical protein [Phreatobacter sp.]